MQEHLYVFHVLSSSLATLEVMWYQRRWCPKTEEGWIPESPSERCPGVPATLVHMHCILHERATNMYYIKALKLEGFFLYVALTLMRLFWNLKTKI